MTREYLRSTVLSKVTDNPNIVLNWCTGLGKSRVSISILDYIRERSKNPIKVLLLLAETSHKKNWENEFKKWSSSTEGVTMECYASLKNYRNTKWDLIIFDEGHHLSDNRLNILLSIEAKNTILLSATLHDPLLDKYRSIFGKYFISRVSLNTAIAEGILPKPKIYVVGLNLEDIKDPIIIEELLGKKVDKIIHIKYSDRWNYLKNRERYKNTLLKIECTLQEAYDYIDNKYQYYKRLYFMTKNEKSKITWLKQGGLRKNILGEAKHKVALKILDLVKDKRFVCFCTSINQANDLGGKYAIHSKNNQSLAVIDDFNCNKINKIFSVGMIQEGQNLNDIQVGIIIQLDGSIRPFVQKFGRALRADSPIQFLIYFRGTRDEEYLKNALEDVNSNLIQFISNEELDNLKI